jgi:hypothetical protein
MQAEWTRSFPQAMQAGDLRELVGREGVRQLAHGKTGKHYRLLSEAEYEYVLRGNAKTQFWWATTRIRCATMPTVVIGGRTSSLPPGRAAQRATTAKLEEGRRLPPSKTRSIVLAVFWRAFGVASPAGCRKRGGKRTSRMMARPLQKWGEMLDIASDVRPLLLCVAVLLPETWSSPCHLPDPPRHRLEARRRPPIKLCGLPLAPRAGCGG